MADIAHTVPGSVLYLDGSEFGLVRPGLQVTPFISGKNLTRDWHGHNIVEYDLNPSVFGSSDDTLEEWETFWHQIDGGAAAGYVVEPISAAHRDLICGGIADGTQTTFPIPVISPSSVTVFVDGAVQESGYTLRSAANLVASDNAASVETDDSAFSAVNSGTIAHETEISLDGHDCLKITPATAGDGAIHTYSSAAPVVVGDDYTGMVWALGNSSFNCRLSWYTAADAWISSSTGSTATSTVGEWTVYTATGIAPTNAAVAKIRIQSTIAGTTPFYADCFGVSPGDYDCWHLPSVAPGLIEFTSAPASGSRITANATGKRVTRCRFEPGTRWSMDAAGNSTVRSIRATEWVEF